MPAAAPVLHAPAAPSDGLCHRRAVRRLPVCRQLRARSRHCQCSASSALDERQGRVRTAHLPAYGTEHVQNTTSGLRPVLLTLPLCVWRLGGGRASAAAAAARGRRRRRRRAPLHSAARLCGPAGVAPCFSKQSFDSLPQDSSPSSRSARHIVVKSPRVTRACVASVCGVESR